MYIPSPKNIPLFEEKGEVQIEVGGSTNSIFVTGSYAFSEKYALIANGSMAYSYINGKPIGRHGGEINLYPGTDVPHRSIEVGLGRYNLLPSSKRRLEVFAGTGYGAAHSYIKDNDKQHYFQGFVQINTGKRYNRTELGWSLRTAFSGFFYQEGFKVIEHGNCQTLHFEPLFVVRTGGQHVKASFRTGFSIPCLLSSPPGPIGGYTLLHFSAGMSFRFKQ